MTDVTTSRGVDFNSVSISCVIVFKVDKVDSPQAIVLSSHEKTSLKTMFKKKSEKLYDDMRDAIERKDRQLMSKIIRDRDYQPNHIGGTDGMTALHIATLKVVCYPIISCSYWDAYIYW